MQEELESLAQQATTNAIYVVKGEKHVFTNNGSYMKLLEKMKTHVKTMKSPTNTVTLAAALATTDEVSSAYRKTASKYLACCWAWAKLRYEHTCLTQVSCLHVACTDLGLACYNDLLMPLSTHKIVVSIATRYTGAPADVVLPHTKSGNQHLTAKL